MFQIVRQRGSYDVRLNGSPIFARFEDAQAWVREFVTQHQDASFTGPEALSVGAIVPESRYGDDHSF